MDVFCRDFVTLISLVEIMSVELNDNVFEVHKYGFLNLSAKISKTVTLATWHLTSLQQRYFVGCKSDNTAPEKKTRQKVKY